MKLLLLLACFQGSELIEQQYRAHIRFLASDALEGRLTASSGQKVAAQYLAAQLALYGVAPAFPDAAEPYMQTYSLDVTSLEEESVSMNIRGFGPKQNFDLYEHFTIRAIGVGDLDLSADMVFLGYGIQNEIHDDYAGVDVEGRWVLILDGLPEKEEGSKFAKSESRPGSRYMKYLKAREMGVAGIIFLRKGEAPAASGGGGGPSMSLPDSETTPQPLFPVLSVYEDQFGRVFGKYEKRFRAAKANIDSSEEPHSFELKKRKIDLSLTVSTNQRDAENVIGILPGTDPQLKDEYLVISAHFDHLGVRNGVVYNGADDNASGTVSVLLAAQGLAHHSRDRSIVFVFFSGEEEGLLGSRYFVENPVVPLEQVVANINIDMVGRNETGEIGVIPSKNKDVSTLNTLLKTVHSEESHGFKLIEEFDRYHGRSDHYTFVRKGIPALFFFSGTHDHYHRPGDDWHLLDYQKMTRFYALFEAFVLEVANTGKEIAFLERETTKPKAAE